MVSRPAGQGCLAPPSPAAFPNRSFSARPAFATLAPMSGQLLLHGDDAPERCAFCGKEAAGPCATCQRSVCGDCCTLTEGGVRTWAICLECDRTKGRSLSRGWAGLLRFIGAILAGLFAVVVLLAWLSGR